jgi:hypothetical protein
MYKRNLGHQIDAHRIINNARQILHMDLVYQLDPYRITNNACMKLKINWLLQLNV